MTNGYFYAELFLDIKFSQHPAAYQKKFDVNFFWKIQLHAFASATGDLLKAKNKHTRPDMPMAL